MISQFCVYSFKLYVCLSNNNLLIQIKYENTITVLFFKGERIMKIKKWLGVAALATVAGLALAACGNSEKADNETVVKLQQLTVAVLKKRVGIKSRIG